jgi:cytidylate kinase
MAIVTISRGSASGGLLLAEGLAKKLEYQLVSREEVTQGAAKYGVSEAMMDKALLDPPTFSEEFKQERRRYLIFIQEALCGWAQKDNVIYHGNAGHLLLRGISHVLRICLIAPLDFRVRTLVERMHMTPEQATAYISKVDAQRRAWTLLLYGVDWLNPNLYNLTINLENMNIDSAVEIAAVAARCPEFASTSQSRKAINNLYLATRVKAALASDPATAAAEVDLKADSGSGAIYLKDKEPSPELAEAIVAKARSVPGVRKVSWD